MPSFSHTQLPYCIQKTADGKWLALNRHYKPVGTTSLDWVDYDSHPNRLEIDADSLEEIRQLSPLVYPDSIVEPEVIYLFVDDTERVEAEDSWSSYSKILRILAAADIAY
jgi:hypothetical protein